MDIYLKAVTESGQHWLTKTWHCHSTMTQHKHRITCTPLGLLQVPSALQGSSQRSKPSQRRFCPAISFSLTERQEIQFQTKCWTDCKSEVLFAVYARALWLTQISRLCLKFARGVHRRATQTFMKDLSRALLCPCS